MLFACLMLAVAGVVSWPQDATIHRVPTPPLLPRHAIPPIPSEASSEGIDENPHARQDYEQAMLRDPLTGQVPVGIRRKEMAFATKLNRQSAQLRTQKTTQNPWKSIGPHNIGGRTRAIAIDVTNDQVLLAGGVSGGIWRSEDEGNSWVKTTLPSSIHSVTCLAQDTRPDKQQIWYYGTGEFTANSASRKAAPFRGDGVFKSYDGGKTWQQLASTAEGVPNNYNSQFQYVWKILPNPDNAVNDEVFVAAVGAIFRSVDGGNTWQVVLGRKQTSTPDTDLNTANISDFTDIARSKNGVYYAVLSQHSRKGTSPDRGVFRSEDGVQWQDITPSSWPTKYERTIIATSPSKPQEVYFSIEGEAPYLMHLSDRRMAGQGRLIWNDLSANIPAFGGKVGDYDAQGSYNMVLAVHPANSDIIFMGGTNLYRSTDAFATDVNTQWIGGYDTANNVTVYTNHYVDQHALAFSSTNPSKMMSSNDGGVFMTDDNTAEFISWNSLNNGFVTTQFYSLALDEFGSKGSIIGGLQDNGTLIGRSPIAESSWHSILPGDGGITAVSKNELFFYASFQFGKLYRFTLDKNNKRTTFARIDPEGSGGEDKLLFVNPYVLAPQNQHIMYFAGGDVMWRNSNTAQIPLYHNYAASVNWQRLDKTAMLTGAITTIKASYNPSDIVYYGTSSGRVIRIDHASREDYTVTEITAPQFIKNAYVSSIAIDQQNSDHVIVSFSNYNIISLYYSDDGGAHFENISGNLEEHPDGTGAGPSVRWVEIVSKNSGNPMVYVATSTGIYSTDQLEGDQTQWTAEGTNEVGNVVVTMLKYFSADGTLVAATHGNGIYESHVDDVWTISIDTGPAEFSSGAPFPNPFSDITTIPFTLPADGMARARIYNSTGQMIKTLLWSEAFKGQNQVSWNGTNENGARVASGIYVCRIEFGGGQIGIRVVLQQ